MLRSRAVGSIVILLCAGALAGCARDSSASTPLMSAEDPAAEAACFANQSAGQVEVWTWVEAGGRLMTGASVEGLVRVGALSKPVVCPAGGEFVFNPNDCSFTCSLHGWAPN